MPKVIRELRELDELALAAKTQTLQKVKLLPAVPPAQPVDTFLVVPDFSVTRVPSVSNEADADVFTQKGRQTLVTVRTQGLSVTANGEAAFFLLVYRIEEMHSDYTTLESRSQIILPAPDGYRILQCGQGLTDANYSHVFPGKDHSWHDVSDQVGSTYLTWLSVKFDGKGRDDEGNAQLKTSIAVPARVVAA